MTTYWPLQQQQDPVIWSITNLMIYYNETHDEPSPTPDGQAVNTEIGYRRLRRWEGWREEGGFRLGDHAHPWTKIAVDGLHCIFDNVRRLKHSYIAYDQFDRLKVKYNEHLISCCPFL